MSYLKNFTILEIMVLKELILYADCHFVICFLLSFCEIPSYNIHNKIELCGSMII